MAIDLDSIQSGEARPVHEGKPAVSSIVWGGAVLIGVAVSAATWDNLWLRLGGPIAVMLIYAEVGRRRPRVDLQQFADSVYFMGFLWTLWALFWGTSRPSSGELSVQKLQDVFGPAILTTGIGMFVRVFMLQAESEREAQQDPAEKIAELMASMVGEFDDSATKIDIASAAFASRLLGSADRLGEAVEASESSIQRSGEAAGSRLSLALEKSGADFTKAMDASREATTAIAAEVGELSRQLGAQTKLLTNALKKLNTGVGGTTDELVRSFESIAAGAKHLEESTTGVAASLAEIGSRANAASKGLGGVASKTGSLEQATTKLTTLMGAAAAGATARTAADLATANKAVGELGDASKELQNTLLEIVRIVRSDIGRNSSES